MFDDGFDYREVANHKELTDLTVALFAGMISAQPPRTAAMEVPVACLREDARTGTNGNGHAVAPVKRKGDRQKTEEWTKTIKAMSKDGFDCSEIDAALPTAEKM